MPNISSILPLEVDVLAWALFIHMFVDLPLQTEWMALNKTNLRHPAAYVHSGLHTLGLLFVFPWWLALSVGISHLLIDTRRPVAWWVEHIKHMPYSTPMFADIEMWLDQVFHIVMIFLATIVVSIQAL
ncbi:MAG: DUF3307 domain-containing protein [Candidatus Promineifilaceae bacterium]|jgi:hypothetical protein